MMKTIATAMLALVACVQAEEAQAPAPVTIQPVTFNPPQPQAQCAMSLVIRQSEEGSGCSARILATTASCGAPHDGYMSVFMAGSNYDDADTLDCAPTLEVDYGVPCETATASLCFDEECQSTQCSATADPLPSCASDLRQIGDVVTPNYFDGLYTYSTVVASYGTYDCVEVGL